MKKRYRKGIGKGTGKGLGRPSVAKVVCPGIGNGISEEVMNGGEQNEERRIDMNTNNQCNHAEVIAKDMYEKYCDVMFVATSEPLPAWEELREAEKDAWVFVANNSLSVIGKHALGDIQDYLGVKAATAKGWKKWLYLGVGIIIAGILGGGALLTLGGCGHNVDVTPERTEMCKDGSCLVVEPGHISYSQAQPETVVPPVVQGEGK